MCVFYVTSMYHPEWETINIVLSDLVGEIDIKDLA